MVTLRVLMNKRVGKVLMEKKHNKKKYLMYLHIAILFMALSGVFGKFVEVPAIMITFGRVLCSAVILLGVILYKKEGLKLKNRKSYLCAIVAGIIVSIHWTAFFMSIQASTVAIGIITFSTFPLFLTFLEPIFYKEKMRLKDVVIAILLLLSVYVTVPDLSLDNDMTIGVIWGMISSLTYAILVLLNRYLAKGHSSRIVALYEHGTATIVLLPIILMTPVVWRAQDIFGVGVIGIFSTALAFTLFISSQKYIRAQTVGVINCLETVYSFIFAFLILSEIPSINEVIGGVMIVSIALYTSLKEG